MNITIRKLEADVDEQANQLLNLAFKSSANRLNDLKLYRQLQPDGWFAAWRDETLVGTVGAISYDTFAHVGFMTVHPDMQGQGIGRSLMEHVLGWLRKQNIPLVTLDATKSGFPLYEKLGFKTIDETVIYERKEFAVGSLHIPGIRPITEEDLDELVKADTPIFGADRRKVFNALLSLYPSRSFLHRDETGKLTGYLFSQMNRIGPWVMLTLGHEAELLQSALNLDYENPLTVCVPSVNQQAMVLLEQVGFIKARAAKHMIKGTGFVNSKREKVFAQTSFGAG